MKEEKPVLTVGEFAEWINRLQVPADKRLFVMASCGFPATGTGVVGLSLGFDWDSGRLFLHPEEPLMRRPKRRSKKSGR